VWTPALRVIGSRHCDELHDTPEPTSSLSWAGRSMVAPAAVIVIATICRGVLLIRGSDELYTAADSVL